MSDYSELFKDPRWQKRRLTIMNRAGFLCERCESDDKTLNVHHLYYKKGAKPWEYPDELLVCWCERCHKTHHTFMEKAQTALAILSGRFMPEVIYGLILSELVSVGVPHKVDIDSPLVARGFGLRDGTDEDAVLKYCKDGILDVDKYFYDLDQKDFREWEERKKARFEHAAEDAKNNVGGASE